MLCVLHALRRSSTGAERVAALRGAIDNLTSVSDGGVERAYTAVLAAIFGTIALLLIGILFYTWRVGRRLSADLSDLAANLDRALVKEFEFVVSERSSVDHSLVTGDAMVNALRSKHLYHEAKNLWERLKGLLLSEADKLKRLTDRLIKHDLKDHAKRIHKFIAKLQKIETSGLTRETAHHITHHTTSQHTSWRTSARHVTAYSARRSSIAVYRFATVR